MDPKTTVKVPRSFMFLQIATLPAFLAVIFVTAFSVLFGVIVYALSILALAAAAVGAASWCGKHRQDETTEWWRRALLYQVLATIHGAVGTGGFLLVHWWAERLRRPFELPWVPWEATQYRTAGLILAAHFTLFFMMAAVFNWPEIARVPWVTRARAVLAKWSKWILGLTVAAFFAAAGTFHFAGFSLDASWMFFWAIVLFMDILVVRIAKRRLRGHALAPAVSPPSGG